MMEEITMYDLDEKLESVEKLIKKIHDRQKMRA
jgi:hypothetical protein